jgi:uncharacterized protein
MGLKEREKTKEEEWVREHEKKLIDEMKKKREERIKEQFEAENQKKVEELRQLHYMHCPKCGHQMQEVSLEHIKIDKCTLCEGIYFDRGELEDLLQKKVEDNKNFFRKLLGI